MTVGSRLHGGDWVGPPPGDAGRTSAARYWVTPSARMLIATPETMWSTPKVTVARAWSRPPSAPHDDADEQPGPRAPLVAGPAGAPGAEDHHALEADVDHARALGTTGRRGRPCRSARRAPSAAPSVPAEVRSSAPVTTRRTATGRRAAPTAMQERPGRVSAAACGLRRRTALGPGLAGRVMLMPSLPAGVGGVSRLGGELPGHAALLAPHAGSGGRARRR